MILKELIRICVLFSDIGATLIKDYSPSRNFGIQITSSIIVIVLEAQKKTVVQFKLKKLPYLKSKYYVLYCFLFKYPNVK